ncbi:hypothetical protein ElyMa_003210600 [Elysia marginata]|uniref:Fibrinogen C-terminal domain-containing protein n=1 Tax=Elysia marginata TaxID=1093978 RepID=A0AAV4J0P3_9GAST|nr:hypothetical protein ElyMa_003210600 [Elysia marginata]
MAFAYYLQKLHTVVFLVTALWHFDCEGFDFSFTPLSPPTVQYCGVLQCSEKLADTKQRFNSDPSGISRNISSLNVYKRSTRPGIIDGGHWTQMAGVTSQSPHINRSTDGLAIFGNLLDTEGSLTLELFRSDDCMSAEFYCVALIVNSNSQSTLKKSFIKNTGGSAINDAEALPSWAAGDAISESRKVGRISNDDGLMFSMLEKLKCIENRMEEYLRDQNRLSDQVQATEIRIGDRIDRLENRLEDKITAQVSSSTNSNKGINGDVCSEMSSKLSEVAESVDTIEKNLTYYQAETAAILTLPTAVTVLNSKIENLTTSLSTITDLTQNLAMNLDDFRTSYSGGALVPADEFFDALGTGKKEWRLVFRGTAENNVAVYPAYLYGTGIPPEVEAGCKQMEANLPCINHYRNKIAMENWTNVDEVLFGVYVKGQMVKRVLFNARDSDYINWFDASRIITSSWTDLKTLSHNIFSISGNPHPGYTRRFHMNHNYQGCPVDAGWFSAFDLKNDGCNYEPTVARVAFPYFRFAPGTTVSRWASPDSGKADAFGVFLKYY